MDFVWNIFCDVKLFHQFEQYFYKHKSLMFNKPFGFLLKIYDLREEKKK